MAVAKTATIVVELRCFALNAKSGDLVTRPASDVASPEPGDDCHEPEGDAGKPVGNSIAHKGDGTEPRCKGPATP